MKLTDVSSSIENLPAHTRVYSGEGGNHFRIATRKDADVSTPSSVTLRVNACLCDERGVEDDHFVLPESLIIIRSDSKVDIAQEVLDAHEAIADKIQIAIDHHDQVASLGFH